MQWMRFEGWMLANGKAVLFVLKWPNRAAQNAVVNVKGNHDFAASNFVVILPVVAARAKTVASLTNKPQCHNHNTINSINSINSRSKKPQSSVITVTPPFKY